MVIVPALCVKLEPLLIAKLPFILRLPPETTSEPLLVKLLLFKVQPTFSVPAATVNPPVALTTMEPQSAVPVVASTVTICAGFICTYLPHVGTIPPTQVVVASHLPVCAVTIGTSELAKAIV